MRKTTRGKAT